MSWPRYDTYKQHGPDWVTGNTTGCRRHGTGQLLRLTGDALNGTSPFRPPWS